jgi:hypothetical protein
MSDRSPSSSSSANPSHCGWRLPYSQAMLWPGWRRATGVFLVLFFLAVTAAPHHHINGLEDLLLDQPSDSGMVIQIDAPFGCGDRSAWNAFSMVDDDPCPACFGNDFVWVPSQVFVSTPGLERLGIRADPISSADPPALPSEASSRAPPSLS